MKLKFIRNQTSLEVTNNTQEIVIFDLKEMIGSLDMRSLGYYKLKQGVLQQNVSKCYHFEPVDRLCEEFRTLVHEQKKDKKILDQEKYLWLEDSDERNYMTNREILDKYIDLDKSCLTESGKKEVRDMIYKYKDAFSQKDEFGTCSNIEIDIHVTDKTPFY